MKTIVDWDAHIDDIIKMSEGKKKARQLAIYGLTIDGAHHKQWFLEHILIALGVDLDELSDEVHQHDGAWEAGIAP